MHGFFFSPFWQSQSFSTEKRVIRVLALIREIVFQGFVSLKKKFVKTCHFSTMAELPGIFRRSGRSVVLRRNGVSVGRERYTLRVKFVMYVYFVDLSIAGKQARIL